MFPLAQIRTTLNLSDKTLHIFRSCITARYFGAYMKHGIHVISWHGNYFGTDWCQEIEKYKVGVTSCGISSTLSFMKLCQLVAIGGPHTRIFWCPSCHKTKRCGLLIRLNLSTLSLVYRTPHSGDRHFPPTCHILLYAVCVIGLVFVLFVVHQHRKNAGK